MHLQGLRVAQPKQGTRSTTTTATHKDFQIFPGGTQCGDIKADCVYILIKLKELLYFDVTRNDKENHDQNKKGIRISISIRSGDRAKGAGTTEEK